MVRPLAWCAISASVRLPAGAEQRARQGRGRRRGQRRRAARSTAARRSTDRRCAPRPDITWAGECPRAGSGPRIPPDQSTESAARQRMKTAPSGRCSRGRRSIAPMPRRWRGHTGCKNFRRCRFPRPPVWRDAARTADRALRPGGRPRRRPHAWAGSGAQSRCHLRHCERAACRSSSHHSRIHASGGSGPGGGARPGQGVAPGARRLGVLRGPTIGY